MHQKLSYEETCRRKANELLDSILIAREKLSIHTPSLGAYGEYLLIKVLREILPDTYGICQGFIANENLYSKQCDIIIYSKYGNPILISFGNSFFINSKNVIAVIEVKSTIQRKTFYTTLKSFEQMQLMGVTNTFLFVYGKISKNSLSNWLLSYKKESMPSGILTMDTDPYDWSDIDSMPKSIVSLESESFYLMEYYPGDNGDALYYMSYKTKDNENKRVSCLQEFFLNILNKINNKQVIINIQDYSIDEGILLFR